MSISTGEVGDRLKMRFNYNTDATFDFENKIKLDYTGHEDDIVKNTLRLATFQCLCPVP